MAKLWDYFDGEPFLENPHLGLALLNRAKKGKKKMAARKKTYRRRGRKATARRRSTRTRTRKARRNAYPMAGLVLNPHRRRKHHSRRRMHNARRRRHSARRNPSLLGVGIPPLNKVLFAGVGFIAPPLVEGFLNGFLPTSLTSNTFGKIAVKVLSVVGLTFAVRRFVGREEGNMVAIGGGVYVAASLINEFAPGVIPWPSLGMYVPARAGLRAYVPSSNVTAMPMGGSVGLPQIAPPSSYPKYYRSTR